MQISSKLGARCKKLVATFEKIFIRIYVTEDSVSELSLEAMSQMVLMDKAVVASLRIIGLRV